MGRRLGKLLTRKRSRDSATKVFRKRRHPRQPFSGSATLYWLGAGGKAHSTVVELVDASEGGMAISVHEPLDVNTHVWILLDDGTDGRGQVRYCNPKNDGFVAGLKFIADESQPILDPGGHRCVLEWIDKSGWLSSCPASVRNGDSGEIEVMIQQIVPCPAIVMLTANQVRCFCCTRDWWPEGEFYCFRVDPLSETHARPLPS